MKINTIYLFVAIMLLLCSKSKLSFSQNIIFVTQNGAGGQSGTSWSNAKSANDLPGVLSNASGKEVWIAEGTYRPSTNNNRSERFKINYGCKIFGGFAGNETQLSQRDSTLTLHKTILSGEIQNDNSDSNNTYNIVQIDSVNNPVYLNSLIVEGANNNASSQHILDDAAVNIEHATVYLDNLEIRNSKPTGIYIQGSKVYIDHSNIHDNQGNALGGGISAFDDAFTIPPHQNYVSIENTQIHDNYASGGGGLYFRFGTPADTLIMESCKIDSNVADVMGAAGLFLDAGQTAILNKVEIKGNSSQVYNNGGEGLFMDYGNLYVNDALIADNFNGGGSGLGGGVFLQTMQKAKFVNCTFADNSADPLGPGYFHFNQLFIASGNVTFENCIFKSPITGKEEGSEPDTLNNFGPPAGWNYYFQDVAFSNCLFDGDFPAFWTDSGNNITNTNPKLSAQYMLTQSSAAIDAGNNFFRNVNYSDDLAGNSRIVNGIVDLGAYEFQGNGNSNGISASVLDYVEIYPNPFTENIIIKGAKIGSAFSLYNISGQSVLQGKINKPVQLIDLSLLANGVYFLGLTSSDNRNIVLKCVKR